MFNLRLPAAGAHLVSASHSFSHEVFLYPRACCAVLAVAALLTTPAAAQTPAWQWGLQNTNPTPYRRHAEAIAARQ